MQKLRDLYNCRGKFLKIILIRKNLQDKWVNFFPTVDKGDLRCYLSHMCM
jgi:hypothetical protein